MAKNNLPLMYGCQIFGLQAMGTIIFPPPIIWARAPWYLPAMLLET